MSKYMTSAAVTETVTSARRSLSAAYENGDVEWDGDMPVWRPEPLRFTGETFDLLAELA